MIGEEPDSLQVGMISVRFIRFFTVFCTQPNQSVCKNEEPTSIDGWRKRSVWW
ncbi:hypothetical protein RHMOL_Rhmol01G0251700 [Rhododendron molle]|uniref:Uncharacterized protein n=1 Tax=Rhododendron molle TaxID=49168 RepID=A0ACC0Q6U7_RHOML|nr:hypothetical protein RHMOL_Rhmol01G0251700 [Rhododendron molle]